MSDGTDPAGDAPSASGPQSEAPGRRERKKREARQRILRAAFDLFVERGFDATTVEDIAQRADVAKGTVFNYFPRKTSFLAAVASDWTAQLLDALGPVDTWHGTTREQLERVCLLLADLGAQTPALSRLAIFESLRNLHAEPSGSLVTDEESVQEFRNIIRAVLERGRTAGTVRSGVATEHAATLIESALFGTLAWWLVTGGSLDGLHREISAKLDVVFDGISGSGGGDVRTDREGEEGGCG